MDIQEIRRENLRKWVKENGTPQGEKSYFSQLLKGGETPFGEKAARRIEADYKMGDKYLDAPTASPARMSAVKDALQTQDEYNETDEIIELLTLFQQMDRRARGRLLDAARSAAKTSRGARWKRVADNEA
jgi:hypothetical protein